LSKPWYECPSSINRSANRGTAASTDYVVATDDTCGSGATDRVVAGAGLAPYDPATGTAPPLAGGPLVDAVPTADCRTTLDQLARPRPSGAACDVGAIEVQVVVAPTTTTTTPGGAAAPPAAPVVGPARFTG